MKQYFVTILASAMLAGCGANPQDTNITNAEAAGKGSQTQAAENIVDVFRRALTDGDSKQAMALLSDDMLIYESGGAEVSKAEYAAHHLDADIAFLKGVKQSISARSAQASGDMALVTTQGATVGTYKDKSINSVSTETMVLRLTEGKWKIVHIHWSSADKKPEAPAT